MNEINYANVDACQRGGGMEEYNCDGIVFYADKESKKLTKGDMKSEDYVRILAKVKKKALVEYKKIKSRDIDCVNGGINYKHKRYNFVVCKTESKDVISLNITGGDIKYENNIMVAING